jgi:hypothetical protein
MEVAMNNITGRPQSSFWRRVRSPYVLSTAQRNLQPLPRVRYTVQPANTVQSRIVTAITNPDFIAIAIFCAIGLLATINLMLRIPDIERRRPHTLRWRGRKFMTWADIARSRNGEGAVR